MADFDRAIECDPSAASGLPRSAARCAPRTATSIGPRRLRQLMIIRANDPETYLQPRHLPGEKGPCDDAAADFQRVLKLTNHSDLRRARQALPSPVRIDQRPGRCRRRHQRLHRPRPPRSRSLLSSMISGSTPSDRRDRSSQPSKQIRRPCSRLDATETARLIGGDPSPPRASGTFTPAVIEDIQIKAELARYRIRGFGSLRPRTWATFDDLTFIPGTLTRIPLEGYREACRSRTVLGTRFATKPIELEIPLMVTGMSYGALSRTPRPRWRGAHGWRARRPPPATAGCSTSNAPSRA